MRSEPTPRSASACVPSDGGPTVRLDHHGSRHATSPVPRHVRRRPPAHRRPDRRRRLRRPARPRARGGRRGSGRLIVQAIEIGARVLDREQAAANTEYVKAEFERQAREVEQQFGERARLVGEQLENAVTAAFGAETGSVPRLLEKHFGDESSGAVQHQVKALVDELLRSHRESLTKQFTAADESNPLAQFQRSAVGAIKQASDQQHVHLVAMNETIVALKAEVAR